MMNRRVMFLDLATVTGWAEGEPGGRAISGRVRLGNMAHPGGIGRGLNNFLSARFQAFKPARLYYESPFLAGTKNANTVRVTYGLAFLVVTLCEIYGIHCEARNLSTIRKGELGFVPRGKDVDVKGVVIQRVRELGYDPADDNEADAILGWHRVCRELDPRAMGASAPLPAKH